MRSKSIRAWRPESRPRQAWRRLNRPNILWSSFIQAGVVLAPLTLTWSALDLPAGVLGRPPLAAANVREGSYL